MIFVIIFLLLSPGLIAVRVLWRNKEIKLADYKFIACDYFIYSFLVQMSVYTFMFLTYPERLVSFSENIGLGTASHIMSASFVFKYSLIALIAAAVLPVIVPRISKSFINLEKKRGTQNKNKSENETEGD